ncbi:MAG: DUF1292 domain-containing protein [Eubacteriales bacterium]|nr:DUF1292 domain-containing protein [Eubacteriales bacterium]
MADDKKKKTQLPEDEEADFVTLQFDDNEEVECEILGVFECDGKEYIALLPDDGSGEVYLYGYRDISDDEFDITDIEDDEEFERVAAEFDKMAVE